MSVPLAGVAILYCEGSSGGIHGELIVGYVGPEKFSGIGKVGGCIKGWLCGFQDGEVIQGNVG